MKADLASSIGLAVVGVIISYLICNLLVSNWTTSDYVVKTIETTVSSDVADPDPNIFNYRSLNPTVEVYVGDCKEYDADGQCIDNGTAEDINQDIIDGSTSDDSGSNSTSPTDNTPTRREE